MEIEEKINHLKEKYQDVLDAVTTTKQKVDNMTAAFMNLSINDMVEIGKNKDLMELKNKIDKLWEELK